jgi:hypothetical protein
VLTEDQKLNYENTRQMAKSELEQIERDIENELARVKEKLLELQQAKKAVKQIYDGCCIRLGLRSTLEMKEINFSEIGRAS